jgi:hypothetical protein
VAKYIIEIKILIMGEKGIRRAYRKVQSRSNEVQRKMERKENDPRKFEKNYSKSKTP